MVLFKSLSTDHPYLNLVNIYQRLILYYALESWGKGLDTILRLFQRRDDSDVRTVCIQDNKLVPSVGIEETGPSSHPGETMPPHEAQRKLEVIQKTYWITPPFMLPLFHIHHSVPEAMSLRLLLQLFFNYFPSFQKCP